MEIAALYIYPIKSCRGVSLTDAVVHDIGLADDRRYMIIDADGTFVTQRDAPMLATVAVTPAANGWHLNAAGRSALEWQPRTDGTPRNARIWKDQVSVVDQGDAVAHWFSAVLDRECRLVGFAPGYRRLVDQTYAVAATDAVSFADGYASLLVTEESLAELNTRMSEAVPMARFRPNIVVRGAVTPWDEDSWRDVTVGAVAMTAVKKCARCVMTTTDQTTGERHAEPLKTLATYRHIGHGLIFGQNMVHRARGVIHVGDEVSISTRQ